MKIKDFCSYVNSELLCVGDEEKALSDRPISHSTARDWLFRLGFKVHSHRKDTFKDGHDDVEVIQYRQDVYLPQIEKWREQALLPQDFQDDEGQYTLSLKSALESAQKRANAAGHDHVLIMHSHDEASYNCNEAEGSHWSRGGDQAITSKSRGSIIMVSDYCNIATGWLELTDEQFEEAKSKHGYEGPQTSRLTLELGGDTPWFDNTQLLKQVQGFHQVSVKVFVSASAFLCACVYVVSPLPPHTHTLTHPDRVLHQQARMGC